MRYFIFFVILTITFQVPVVLAKEPPNPHDLVTKYAQEYGVRASLINAVINCEDGGWDPTKQSDIVKNGKREESYGLAQIHLPSHPEISYSQAIDPEFAIKFLAENLAKGNGNMWSCYRKI